MKMHINVPEALLAQISARDYGKGLSAAVVRLMQRGLRIAQHGARTAPPSKQDIETVAAAIRDGTGPEGVVGLITDDPVAQVALLDAAEQLVTSERRGKQ